MKHLNKIILSSLAVGMLITSCIKEDINEGITNTEQTIVKLPQGASEIYIAAFDAVPGEINAAVLEVRRDVKTEADLNKSQTIRIERAPTLIADYNAAHSTGYEEFSAFSSSDESPFDGQGWSVAFNPGEFMKQVKIKFDPGTIDLSKQYAIGFRIADAAGSAISAGNNEALGAIAIKNAYHGTYQAAGVFHHPTAGDRAIDEQKELVTSGANSVSAPLGDLGGAGYGMNLTVNPDNTVTITPLGATPNIDQHWGANYYDPATESFHLHYSYNVAAPRIIEETITRK
jgi:Domain of unknown function (DUF4361)/Domain of unknown function (DUF1735)